MHEQQQLQPILPPLLRPPAMSVRLLLVLLLSLFRSVCRL
jgi:hypothetical protein